MENLPEALNFEIIKRLTLSDRNSLSLVSKQLYKIEADQRLSIRVGCRLNPATEALTSLCIRFSNLTKIEINYYGWESYLGKQLDDQGLFILSINCPSLTNLILCHCSFLTDSGLSHLTSCKKLVDLSIVDCRVIKEHSLIVLGKCLRRLKRLELNLGPLGWHPKKPLVAESRAMVLKDARFLNDSAMKTLSLASPCLETLELERAHKVTNLGIGHVIKFPRLVNLKITECDQITDDGLKPLVETKKFVYLMIKNCPCISDQGAQQAAKHVCYEHV
ncbi:hypothetical protein LUZ60_000908 [Juncus effusus]|nr:hypothetical protein LUZ60_000908 [Juncus effusus]